MIKFLTKSIQLYKTMIHYLKYLKNLITIYLADNYQLDKEGPQIYWRK